MPEMFGSTRTARPGFRWEYNPGQWGGGWREVAIPGYVPPATPGPASVGISPGTTGTGTPYPQIPEFGLPDIAQITAAINQMTGDAFNAEADNRIPGQAGLEAASSAGIQQLLSPPEYFPGTSRTAAEEASGRGIPGSGAADSTWVRRTREEQLREMGLGQQFFNAAIARNPIAPQYDPSGLANYMAQLPGQRAQLLTQQQQFAQSQQQQRDLAIAQMENAFRLAQIQALRGGSALRGGGGPSYGYRPNNAGASTGATSSSTIPPVPQPTAEGWGQAWTETPEPFIPSPGDFGYLYETPPWQGWDLPIDIPIDFDALADPDAMYA